MPKMKTHRGLAKRLKRTGSGKLKRGSAYTSHMFSNKSQDQKRKLRKGGLVSKGDQRRIAQLITHI
ncbi:50S ribosomal protein L35 [Desulfuribacillus alkaliarsenatis]|uniref:Large ribosomal subunit protein bL35 n=1 Tax=Desulfuribacillus alkaliarsenatis TaxID=766136 RepID=A0A1E5FYN8_9FIRM|nr:50S ribosomal protein L35 [Desulfuribacillus alkaliarsenatis]OEF95611.1 50S ribosomal protein L35 [Desulfuribacillus alkaliarsenatis]